MKNIKKVNLDSKNFFIKISNSIDYTFENPYFLIKIIPFFLIILLLIVGFYFNYRNLKLLEKYQTLGQVSQQVLKYDLLSENSITKYVGKGVGIGKDFQPQLKIFSSKNIIGQATLTPQAGENFLALASGFYENFGKPIKVVSSYRSYQYQENLVKKDPSSVEEGFRANPGESEHQLGLALDIFETTNLENFSSNPNLLQYRSWLQNNSHKYGFTQSYKFGANIDGYNIEPWHRRYIGVDLATELYKKNISFSQYYRIFY